MERGALDRRQGNDSGVRAEMSTGMCWVGGGGRARVTGFFGITTVRIVGQVQFWRSAFLCHLNGLDLKSVRMRHLSCYRREQC